MKFLQVLRNKYLCFVHGHKYLIDEYGIHGMVVASQCFKCGKRIAVKGIDV